MCYCNGTVLYTDGEGNAAVKQVAGGIRCNNTRGCMGIPEPWRGGSRMSDHPLAVSPGLPIFRSNFPFFLVPKAPKESPHQAFPYSPDADNFGDPHPGVSKFCICDPGLSFWPPP